MTGMGGVPASPIHRVWIGGPEPEWLRSYASTWRDHHPDRQLTEWTDDNVESLFPLHNQDLWVRAPEIAPNHVGQFRADVLRYELLWRFGGWYVDADFRCLRPLTPFVEDLDCWATWEKQDRWVANCLMGATPNHPFVGRIIDGLADSVKANPGARPAVTTGPQFVTKLWKEHRDEVAVLPEKWFYPYSYSDVARHPIDEEFTDPELVAVHAWHNRRRERGLL